MIARRLGSGVALVLTLAFTDDLHAQARRPAPKSTPEARPASVAPLAESLSGPAREAYEAGRLLFSDKDYAGALVKFKRSHELSKDARLLWNMAVCEKNLRHYVRVRGHLEQYLREGGDALTPENRAAAAETLAAIKPFIGTVVVTVNEPGAAVSVDGEAVGNSPLPGPVSVDLGRHALRVDKPGFTPYQKDFDASGGEKAAMAITLSPGAVVAPATPRPTEDAPPPAPAGSGRRTLGLVVGGVGVVVVGVGAVFGVRALGRASDADALCRGASCTDRHAVDLNDQAKSSARIADVALGIGLVATGVGAYLFLSSPAAEKPTAQAFVRGHSTPGGGAISGGFTW